MGYFILILGNISLYKFKCFHYLGHYPTLLENPSNYFKNIIKLTIS